MRSRFVVAFAALLVLGVMAPVQGAGHWEAAEIASGLDNPRGIDVGADGTVYVALSGSGGSALVTGPVQGSLADVCAGDSGAVIALDGDGGYETVAELPSFAAAESGGCVGTGFAATGPSNISALGKGTLQLAMGLGGGERGDVSGAFGATHSVLPNGNIKPLADILGVETATDPDEAGVDSNPYGIDQVPGGTLVADAGANALFLTRPNGSVETVAVFPPLFGLTWPAVSCPLPFPPAGDPVPFPVQQVPTSVAVGPDGAYYVGTLVGFPFPTGGSAVYRVDQHTGAVTNYVSGLTHVTGLEWGPDGALYVAQMTNASLLDLEACGGTTPGSVLRISASGTETIANLPIVGDVAVGADGVVYATTGSILPSFAGGGSVYALTP